MKRFIWYLILCFFGGVLLGAEEITLQIDIVDINNKTFSGSEITIDEKGKCTLIQKENQKKGIDLSDILEIAFNTPLSKEKPYWEITFTNNDLVYGRVGETGKDGFQFESITAGKIGLRFDNLLMLQSMFNPYGGEGVSTDTVEDTVYLANGDNDKGVVLILGKKGLKLQSSVYNKERSYNLREISAVVFSQIKPPPKPTEKLIAVLIGTDRTCLTGQIKKTEIARTEKGQQNIFYFHSVYGNEYQIPLSRIAQIYFKTERCVYLSDLEPTAVKEYPTLPGLFPWKYQKDKNVTSGNLISFKGKIFYKGLGVHANCELTYKLNGKYKRFFALAGLDDEAAPRASVQFLVFLDNKKAYESDIIKWGDEPKQINLSVKGAKEMRIVVTDGGDMHILDRAAWAIARLIK